jgi:hypothetical protein
MNKLAVLMFAAMILAACGDKNPREAPWLPNFDSPETASETYARAIESGNLELAILCVAPSERESVAASLSRNLRAAEQGNLRFEVEYFEPGMLSETEAFTGVTYHVFNEEGELEQSDTNQLLWVQQPDGTWRQSPNRLKELRDAAEAARQQPEQEQESGVADSEAEDPQATED